MSRYALIVASLRRAAGRIGAWSALIGAPLFAVVACDSSYNVAASDSTDGGDSGTSGGGGDGSTANGGSDAASSDAGNVVTMMEGGADAADASVPLTANVGSGVDGALTPNGNMFMLNVQCYTHVKGTAGTTLLSGVDHHAPQIVTGAMLLIYTPQGAGAGVFEYATVGNTNAMGLPGNSTPLVAPLKQSYTSATVYVVKQYTNVTIPSGMTFNANPWDGNCGGVIVFKATGTVSIAGKIDMTGRGFRGNSHVGVCGGATPYECNSATPNTGAANGFAGESEVGPPENNYLANGMGGGGGQDGADCGEGGGGGHGAAGGKGANGSATACRTGVQQGGQGGNVGGTANLTAEVFLGGAGGEGGGDDDGAYPGAGGNGGGLVLIDAQTINITGGVLANGSAGGDGVQNDATCGGAGSGMGGGGGGAGGTIRLAATTGVTLGNGLVSAAGGVSGHCATPTKQPAGAGAVGRIAVNAAMITGTTSPAYDPR
jgi:hypothetical protein